MHSILNDLLEMIEEAAKQSILVNKDIQTSAKIEQMF